MMIEDLYGELGVFLLRRHYDPPQAGIGGAGIGGAGIGGAGIGRAAVGRAAVGRAGIGLHETFWLSSVSIVDLPAIHGLSAGAPPAAVPKGSKPHPVEPGDSAPLTAIGRILAAIRRWREHTRAQAQLRQASDHLLKDIGLNRVGLAYDLHSRSGAAAGPSPDGGPAV
jgi:uncharacterized protein YjiS (DUF1127 family)